MEVSFSGGETLKGGNVKIIKSRLNFALLFFSFFILFSIHFPFFYF